MSRPDGLGDLIRDRIPDHGAVRDAPERLLAVVLVAAVGGLVYALAIDLFAYHSVNDDEGVYLYQVELDTGESIQCMHNHDEDIPESGPVDLELGADHELAWFPREQRPEDDSRYGD